LESLAIVRNAGIHSTALGIIDIVARVRDLCRVDLAGGLVKERNDEAWHGVVIEATA